MADPDIFKALSAIVFIGATAFIALFAREPWHKTHFGRSLMVMAVGLWLFALTSVLRQWLGPNYPGRIELRIVAQCLIAYGIWSRLVVLAVARRSDRTTTE